MHFQRVLLIFPLLFCILLPLSSQAFKLDDLEKLEKAEQEDLLAKAGQAARSWDFGTAHSYLKQAQNKGYAPTEIQATEKIIAQNQSAKADKDRREEEARQAQVAAAQAARQNAASASSASSGGSRSPNFVSIEVSCKSPMCNTKDLKISRASGSDGGHGEFYPSFGGSIQKGYDGTLAGVYNFSVRLEPFAAAKAVCSGSFRLNGNENIYYLQFHTDCRDAGSYGH